jgi:hypothetical protein
MADMPREPKLPVICRSVCLAERRRMGRWSWGSAHGEGSLFLPGALVGPCRERVKLWGSKSRQALHV